MRSSQKGLFALKRLNPLDNNSSSIKSQEARFRNEFEQLVRFNGRRHPHLVTLLASYEFKKEYYFLFPYANGDLDRYWEANKTLSKTHKTTKWLARQFSGLIGAVYVMHEPKHVPDLYAWHGDIKSENILWYECAEDDLGILVLTDMGLAEVHRQISRSNQLSQKKARTPEYRPPEFDDKKGKITRSFDIWTLGCLFLDIVTWYIWGYDDIINFSNKRKSVDWCGMNTEIYFQATPVGTVGPNQESTHLVSVKPAVSEVSHYTARPLDENRILTYSSGSKGFTKILIARRSYTTSSISYREKC